MTITIQTEALFKSRTILLDHLKQRGFDVSNYEGSSVTEVHSMQTTKQLDMLVETEKGKKAYIKYHIIKNLRSQNIYEYVEDLFDLEEVLKKEDDLIIIIKDEPNDSLRQIMKNLWAQDGIFITILNINRLQYNLMEHELVPPHRILSKEEDEAIRVKYNIKNDKMIPDISRFSPVSLVIGIRPGEICEILRPSLTAITGKFYRICSA